MSTRIFLAVMPPRAALQRLHATFAPHQRRLGPFRWTEPEQYHLTLAFLGEVPDERVTDVVEGVGLVAGQHRPFEVSIKGIGAFPNLLKPNVLWAGVSGGADRLSALSADLVSQLQLDGFEPDPKPQKPHLTLGRAQKGPKIAPVDRIALDLAGLEFGSFEVTRVSVMSSELAPSGPIYAEVGDGRFQIPLPGE
jgi:2'-5' RNA ligase